MLHATSLTHLLLMQTLITLQTIQNYNVIRKIVMVFFFFHNTECGNKGNKLKGWLLLLLLNLLSLRLHRFSLWCCNVINERLKPEDSKGELINFLSSSDGIGHTYEAVT